MSNRHTKLLQVLRKEGGYVNGNKLSDKLGVSVRTIRNDVRSLNSNYLLDAHIKSNNKFGYKIEGKMKSFKKVEYPDFVHRAFFIVQYLIEDANWLTYKKIAENIMVSSQTVSSDLLKISELIGRQHYNVTLKTKPFTGICLVGSEADKRLLLASLVKRDYASKEELQHELNFLFHKWFSKKEIEDTIQIIYKNIKKYKLIIDIPILSKFAVNVLIQKHRIINFSIPKYEIKTDPKFKEFKEAEVAHSILNDVVRLREKGYIETEIQYLTLHMVGLKILNLNHESKEEDFEDSFNKKVEKALQFIGKQYGYELISDQQLIKNLTAHLEKTIYPIKYHIEINNVHLKYIKSEYIQAYQMSVAFSSILNNIFSVQIPENEVGYIALHIEAALERTNNLSTKAILLSGESEVITTLIKQKIESNLNQIQITDVYSLEAVEEIPDDISLVISTDTVEVKDKKTVLVNKFLQHQDLWNIRKNITTGIIKDRVGSEHFTYLNEQTKESFLRKMVVEFGLERYFKSVLDRESLSATNIGNNIALPHPLFSANESQSFIYVGINKSEILWGDDTVKLVFLLILSEQDKLQYEYIYREVYRLMKYKFKIEQLTNAKNYKDFIRFL